MKKILLVLLALLLCGCTKQYQELGYSKDEARVISSLNKDYQAFFSENINDFYKALFDNKDFNSDNLETYLLFENYIDAESVVELVNNGLINSNNKNYVIELSSVEGFDVSKLSDYLKLYKKYEPVVIVGIINNNLISDLNFVDELTKDTMFVSNNFNLYVKYKDRKDNIRDLVEYVNTKNYLKYYDEQTTANVDKYGYLTLVNKFYYLDKDYEPDDLVDVEIGYGVGRLRKEAYDSYKIMSDDAKKQGYSFYITSPFRSYDTQDKLYKSYLLIDTQEEVDIYSARPGSSEHQLGLAVDILKSGYDFDTFYKTPEAKWLCENAYKYGFILRYPKDKVDITGYEYEPWHFRYVGGIAETIYNSGVTFDEYFEKYIK